jgi:phage terminase large subunit
MNRASLEIKAAAVLELQKRKAERKKGQATVVGIVCPKDGHTHSLVKVGIGWVVTKEEVDVYLAAKLEPVLKSTKRFIVVVGGRGSGKSVGIADICLIDAKDSGAKTFCLREFQSSIKNSVHSLIKEEIKRLQLAGFEAQAQSILFGEKDAFQFAGLSRNVDSIKSAHGFKRYWAEESQFISKDSLTALTPTARKKPKRGLPNEADQYEDEFNNVSMIFVANPGSSEDPLSKRFITPFQDALDRDGIYEDDLHLVVMMNYTDNPWYEDSGLEDERAWDKENRSGAEYDHIWLGAYNDSVENSLIMSEWFDACVDAHLKLGFKPTGVKLASHDPSDTGPDSKGYAMRHGSVVLDAQEKETGNVNEGGHWAVGQAIQQGVDQYTWDCDGMGIALAEQTSADFDGKRTKIVSFRGSEAPDNPEAIYKPAMKSPVDSQKTIGDSFKNKRAQYYFELRDRCYRTYRAVTTGEYHDPDTLISFSSDIAVLKKIRAELCRMPIKPNGNGLFQLYTKDEMKTKFKIKSPNLGDSIMMLMRYMPSFDHSKVKMPKPNRPMRLR